MKKMRRLTLDYTQFLADYKEAFEAGITVNEFCQLIGLSIGGLHTRMETLAKRGVLLPLLKGMHVKSRQGARLAGKPMPTRRKPGLILDAIHVEPVPSLPEPVADEPGTQDVPVPAFAFTAYVGSGF